MERKVANISEISEPGTATIRDMAPQIDKMSEIHHFSKTELDQLKILYQGSPHHNLLKVFRELRTRVYSQAKDGNFVCMITSAVPKGGSSHVTRNLAAAIALDRTRSALIVDANFYSPGMEHIIVTDSDMGLTDYLDNPGLGVESIVYASGIPRVRVVPVGSNTEGATEKLATDRMYGLINELRSRYPDRYILVDAPSAGEFNAETRLMAEFCDFALLVVPSGMVTDAALNTAIEALGEDKIAAYVFNNAKSEP